MPPKIKSSHKDSASEDIQLSSSSNQARKTIHQLLTMKVVEAKVLWPTGQDNKSLILKYLNKSNSLLKLFMIKTVRVATCVLFPSFQALWTQPHNNVPLISILSKKLASDSRASHSNSCGHKVAISLICNKDWEFQALATPPWLQSTKLSKYLAD